MTGFVIGDTSFLPGAELPEAAMQIRNALGIRRGDIFCLCGVGGQVIQLERRSDGGRAAADRSPVFSGGGWRSPLHLYGWRACEFGPERVR